jgi:hypothetical protein
VLAGSFRIIEHKMTLRGVTPYAKAVRTDGKEPPLQRPAFAIQKPFLRADLRGRLDLKVFDCAVKRLRALRRRIRGPGFRFRESVSSGKKTLTAAATTKESRGVLTSFDLCAPTKGTSHALRSPNRAQECAPSQCFRAVGPAPGNYPARAFNTNTERAKLFSSGFRIAQRGEWSLRPANTRNRIWMLARMTMAMDDWPLRGELR